MLHMIFFIVCLFVVFGVFFVVVFLCKPCKFCNIIGLFTLEKILDACISFQLFLLQPVFYNWCNKVWYILFLSARWHI